MDAALSLPLPLSVCVFVCQFQPFLQMAASAEQTNLRRILVAKLGDLVSLATRPRDEPMADDNATNATEDGADIDNIMERFVSLGLAKLLGVLILDRDTGVAERALDAIVKMVGSAAGSDSFFEGGGLLDWLLDKIKTARDVSDGGDGQAAMREEPRECRCVCVSVCVCVPLIRRPACASWICSCRWGRCPRRHSTSARNGVSEGPRHGRLAGCLPGCVPSFCTSGCPSVCV